MPQPAELLEDIADSLPKLGCMITTKTEDYELESKIFTDELVLAEYLVKTYYQELKNRGVL